MFMAVVGDEAMKVFPWIVAGLLCLLFIPNTAESRPVTVNDSISMRTFINSSGGPYQDLISFSPNNDKFFVVTLRGDLQTNHTVGEIFLFESKRGWRNPKRIAEITTISNRIPILSPSWSKDGNSILFRELSRDGVYRVSRTSVRSNIKSLLTPPGRDVADFSEVPGGVVYLERLRSKLPPAASFTGTGHSLSWLLFPDSTDSIFGTQALALRESRNGADRAVMNPQTRGPILTQSASLFSASPNGKMLVTTFPIPLIPDAWAKVSPRIAKPELRLRPGVWPGTQYSQYGWPQQYGVVNLGTGSIQMRVAGPLGQYTGYHQIVGAKWLGDGDRVELLNSYIPEYSSASGLTDKPCDVVVNLSKRMAECVIDTQNFGMRWPSKSDQFIKARFVVDESLSVPPRVLDNSNGRQNIIWDPNPQLKDVDFGKVDILKWKDERGAAWTGGLVKPPDFKQGKRYPLVIQTHGFRSSKFMMDGPYTTAFAARALAARGMLVLQVEEIGDGRETPERPRIGGTLGYESGVKKLVDDGLVDGSRVGIIGFSVTGWYVLDNLLYNPTRYRAATLAEFTSGTYWELLQNVDYGGQSRLDLIKSEVGSMENPTTTLKNSIDNKLVNLSTPLRIEENSPSALIYNWDVYSSLRYQKKPIELIYIPEGQHVLVKPWERLASQQGNVDWFSFWLQGYEDPDPAKAEQYTRWRELRDAQAAVVSATAR